ncbi:MAG TPA: prolipoprotein diacylglyceryl transferase [Pseudomonadales bacterium]|jgi:phosphatidylglycerol:prolipoprotein diacylglycerol transferase|nr:prolipoprotein diacylglyceryl transferase [Gammaproteobacteria bacterium]MDP6025543.1 prolipoprotein diacylglyceryl transferase [Pseudomonadales bacterium]MDP6315165.1 prolipoprotein diacylglyceryl transferase [Pseudomonadales bacterium]MDP7314416.1 prolipoprotein diacylglyceryl transferase [Pseudomonadales bacterium]HJL60629.1 prolipoprotein diacylglyceryl transferase [Pseudomonadales bacterium]|tara:strand:+ start:2533 stop:3339 length:807 start_codon:yes stop_codon:yes gene_type:complete
MWNYPEFDPVALSLGPISIHWYALSYLVGILLVWRHASIRSRTTGTGSKKPVWTEEHISDAIFYGVFGVILGGRIGYMLFYGRQELVDDPLALFKVWQGGMSFHGGMLGVFVAAYLLGRLTKKTFFEVTDFIAPSIPIALGCGRLGNFINGELPGRVTDVPWAAIYPGDIVGRHPSSLYQAFLEGPVLFLILWLFTRRVRPVVSTSGIFLIGYGSLRFCSEIFREPDAHLGFVAFEWLTTGQLLSLPMILIGICFLVWSYRHSELTTN